MRLFLRASKGGSHWREEVRGEQLQWFGAGSDRLSAASWAAAVSMQGRMAMRQACTTLLPTLSSPSSWNIVK